MNMKVLVIPEMRIFSHTTSKIKSSDGSRTQELKQIEADAHSEGV